MTQSCPTTVPGSKLDIVPDHAPVTNDHPFVDVTKIPNGDVLARFGLQDG